MTTDLTDFLAARLDEDEDDARRAYETRHDLRPLAELQAKRRIVEAHPHVPAAAYLRHDPKAFGCSVCARDHGDVEPHGWCLTLQLIASVYSTHPDYGLSWRQA